LFFFLQTGPLAITAGPGRTPLSPVNKGGYRPRATTESGQRPSRPMRQTTLDESGRHNKTDLGSSVDSGNEVFASSVENDPEVSREKGLPTIFKYQGQGKEVYVCGKDMIRPGVLNLFGFVRKFKCTPQQIDCQNMYC